MLLKPNNGGVRFFKISLFFGRNVHSFFEFTECAPQMRPNSYCKPPYWLHAVKSKHSMDFKFFCVVAG